VIVMDMVCEMMKISRVDNIVIGDIMKVMICEVKVDMNVNVNVLR
jgi:hypothetical protein